MNKEIIKEGYTKWLTKYQVVIRNSNGDKIDASTLNPSKLSSIKTGEYLSEILLKELQ